MIYPQQRTNKPTPDILQLRPRVRAPSPRSPSFPPPPLPLFISAAPSSVVGPRARNQCLLRGDSVTDVKRGDGWRVVPFASRLSHVLFDSLRDLSDQCGGRGEEGKGERSGSFLRRSLDQVVG